jgi:translocation and assembly module TamA
VGVSSDTGPRVSVEHLHRLLFGKPWQAKSKVQWGRDESVVQTDLTSHPRRGGKRWLAALQFARQVDADSSLTLSGRLRGGLQSEGDRLERTSYVEYQRALVYSNARVKLSEASAITATQQWLWRDLDNTILPTKGVTANLSAGLGQTFSTLNDRGLFGRAYGRLTWYRPLPLNWYATARAEAGLVLAQPGVSVPDTLLFKAGGDESVRGYAYRSLGDVQDGVTLGGRTLLTGSMEVAHPISDRFPSLWGALFTDVGDAATTWRELSPRWGYGAGLRWRSPVGALRLDAAYGQETHEYRFHFSVGISL